jgi:hypothetical protein
MTAEPPGRGTIILLESGRFISKFNTLQRRMPFDAAILLGTCLLRRGPVTYD